MGSWRGRPTSKVTARHVMFKLWRMISERMRAKPIHLSANVMVRAGRKAGVIASEVLQAVADDLRVEVHDRLGPLVGCSYPVVQLADQIACRSLAALSPGNVPTSMMVPIVLAVSSRIGLAVEGDGIEAAILVTNTSSPCMLLVLGKARFDGDSSIGNGRRRDSCGARHRCSGRPRIWLQRVPVNASAAGFM